MKKTKDMETILIVVLGIAIVLMIGFIGTIFFMSSSNKKIVNPPKTKVSKEANQDISEENEEIVINNFQVARGASLSETNNNKTKDAEDSEFVFAESDSRYLTKSDLKGLTKEELSYGRNEIYARHGRIFHSDNLKHYFASKSWYVPLYEAEDFPEEELSEYEKENVKFILNYEKEKGYQ